MKKNILVLLMTIAVSGCAKSGIVKISENELYITEASNLGISHGTLRIKALEKAKVACGEKDVVVISDETGGATGWTATTVNIRFRCE
ncbi:hypothetical protein [Desulfonatronum lacustre]|uniref:hypothetical protein n=1 Tax=Desulfonatronum lacustre TaxID=66849 RepID=UPI0012EB4BD1|nr:hypothetical protein [Desulfonatronum lacustre]